MLKTSLWALYGSQRGEIQGGPFFNHMVHWSSVTFYTQYDITDLVSIGTRLEHFDNRDGARPLLTNNHGTYVDTVTLTANIQLQNGTFLLKPEIRLDYFQRQQNTTGEPVQQQFADNNGNFSRNSQTTAGLAAIIKF